MKKTITLIIALLASISMYAQAPIAVGQSQFNAGVGLSSWGVPVYVGFDYGVHPDITLGAEASFRSYRNNWSNRRYNHSIIGISGNANYHLNRILDIPSNWDLYAGLNIGFYIWNSPDGYEGTRSSGLGVAAQVGGRYYFSEKFGLNLEFGGGNAFSGGKFGISIKL
jgi:outer membrane immunogenic protein